MTTLETNNMLISTQKVIEEALLKLGYGQDMIELLKEPMRLLTVRIPYSNGRWNDESVYRLPGTA